MVIHEEGKREKMEGITCYMNEEGRLIRARENHQQLTMVKSGRIYIMAAKSMFSCTGQEEKT